MSSERTTPPSIAPKKPAGRPRPTADEARPTDGRGDAPVRPAARPVTGGTAPSVGERIRRTAAGVAEAAKTVLPTRDDREDDAAAAPAAATTATARAPRPAAASPSSGPRRVRLAIARVDPWSVMKLSFLLSVAVGIMIVVAAAVVWYTLDGLAVFTSVNDTIAEITGDPDFFNLLEYAAFPRVVSLATMIAVVDVVLLTALATIGAFLYNITAALVGGLHLTLTDE